MAACQSAEAYSQELRNRDVLVGAIARAPWQTVSRGLVARAIVPLVKPTMLLFLKVAAIGNRF